MLPKYRTLAAVVLELLELPAVVSSAIKNLRQRPTAPLKVLHHCGQGLNSHLMLQCF